MKDLRKSLAEKGWAKKDISKAIKIIEKARQSKHPKIKLLDKAVYWVSLLVAIAGNFIISIALIPFLLVLNSLQLYGIIAIIGLSFGLLFELLIRRIENLEAKHHIFLGIAIPLLAIANFIIVSNNMKLLVGVESRQNPVIAGSLYAIAFILPYILYQAFLKNRY